MDTYSPSPPPAARKLGFLPDFRNSSWPLAYSAALAATLVGILVRAALTPLIGPTELSFSISLLAILWAAWFGGLGPGAMCTVVSALASVYYFVLPTRSLSLTNARDRIDFAIFLILGLGMAWLADSQRRALRRAAHAENAERMERQRFETTLASIGDAVVATDNQGRITFANKVALDLFRASRAAITGRPLQDVFRIVNEYTRETVESPVAKVLRHGAIVGLANHTVLIAQDGTEVPIDDSAAPIRNGNGVMQGTVLVFRDITERRRSETTRQLLASVIESSEDAIITQDLDGIVTSWNRGAERTYGYSAQEMIGKPIAQLAVPDRGPEMAMILEQIRNGEHVDHYRTLRRTKAGALIHTSLSVSPVRDAAGRITGAARIARDVTAEVQAQAEIAEHRERLRVTLNSIGDAVLTTGPDARITYLNPVAEQLTGWSTGEAAGQPMERIFRIVNEDSRQPVENPVTKVLKEGRVVGLANHTVLLSRDGKEVAIDDSAAPIRSAAGEMLGVVLVFRDITQRRETERLIEAQTRELRQRAHLMERVHCFVRDLEDRIVYWNPGVTELYGYSAEEAVGQAAHILLRTEFSTPLERIRTQVMNSGQWDGELVHIRRDGQKVIVASHWALHRDPEGRPLNILEVCTDITARKQAEDAVRKHEDQLAMVMNALPVGVGMIDSEGNVVTTNPAWKQFVHGGIPSLDDRENTRWRAAGADGKPLARSEFPGMRALRGDEVVPGIDFLRKQDDGAERWTRMSSTPLRDSTGRVTGALVVVEDIDEARRAADQRAELLAKERALGAERLLRQTEAELARVARALSVAELATSIAHEINQPLAGVVTNAEAGLRWLSGESPNIGEARQSLTLVSRDGNRAGAVIRRIREFLRKEPPPNTTLDLREVIQEAVALAGAELRQREIVLRTEFPDEVLGIRGDRIQLQQVLLNLMINGAEAMNSIAGPKNLLVAAERSADGSMQVSVRDSGTGIAVQDLPRMFETFFSTKPSGMGMGLSISRSIIEAHGGRIWAAPNDGAGLTVRFDLPPEESALAAGIRP